MAIAGVLEVPTDRPPRGEAPRLTAVVITALTAPPDRPGGPGSAATAFAAFLAVLHRCTGADELVLAGWAGGPGVRVLAGPRTTLSELAELAGGATAGAAGGLAAVVQQGGRRLVLQYDPALFDTATVERLGGHVATVLAGAAERPGTPISSLPLPLPEDPVAREHTVAPLSPAQRQLWLLTQMYPDLYAYHLPIAFELRGDLDVAALGRSLTALLTRHEALRARIGTAEDGTPVQILCPPAPVDLPVTDVAEVGDDLLRERLRVPFDLARGPLLRAELFRAAADRHVLLLTSHHIVGDAWSTSVIVGDLGELYRAEVEGTAAGLPPLPPQFAHHLLRPAERPEPDALEYWAGRLAGLGPLDLPTDRPRTAERSFEGRRATAVVPAPLLAALRAVGREFGASDFMLVAAGLQAILGRYSGACDVAVAVVLDGADRSRPGLDRVVGHLVNTLALRTDLDGGTSYAAVLRQVRDAVLEAHDRPLEPVIGAVMPTPDVSRPAFPVVLSCLNPPEPVLRLPGLQVDARPFDPRMVRSDIDVSVTDSAGEVVIDLDHRTDLWDEATGERLVGDLVRLLEAAAATPAAPLADLDLVGPAQREELYALGRRPYDYPTAPLVPQRVAEWARRTPDAVAVEDRHRSLTYAGLEQAATATAARLRAAGVGPDALVGVLATRSVEYVAALYGVFKAGAGYVPMDPTQPDARLAEMLTDSGAPIVLVGAEHAARVADLPITALLLDEPGEPAEPPAVPGRPDTAPRAAYVIYTSGSTGRPKGVLVEHRSLLNMCQWNNRAYGIAQGDRAAMIAAQGFDASVWDIWPNLIAGASVVVCDEDTRHDPDAVTAWLIDNHIDVAFLATPLAEAVLGTERVGELPLRAILTGGDALRQRPRPGLGVTVYNHYGPTETTVIVTHGTVADSDTDRVITIGVPTDNAELYLLDERGRLAPRGIGGELYIGGVQVARGYLDRPDLNRERFVPSPFTSGGRLYRTGDLARWRNNGELEFLGRADRQIKVRGFRIEPGEIETRLRAHPAVADAFVIADGVDANRRRLVAYLAPAPAAAVPDATELRALLRGQLPDYMVPAQFVAVGALPMSPNGKVDRLRLPAPPAESAPEAEPVEPRDEVERAVAAVFAAVLERERVGVHDNFFELGGHSLRAGRLAAALRRDFNIDLPMKAVFAGPTVAEIAVALVETALAGAA